MKTGKQALCEVYPFSTTVYSTTLCTKKVQNYYVITKKDNEDPSWIAFSVCMRAA